MLRYNLTKNEDTKQSEKNQELMKILKDIQKLKIH